MRMYGDDNTDRFAFCNWDGGAMGYPRGWLYYTTNNGNGSSIPDPAPGGNYQNVQNLAYQTGLWFNYCPNPKAYLCPVDIQSKTYKFPATGGGRNNRMSSYVMNGAQCGYQNSNAGEMTKTKTSDAWSGMCYIMWEPDENANGPGDPGAFEFNDAANFPQAIGNSGSGQGEGIGRLHSKNGGNILALAGHVTFISSKQFASDSRAVGTPRAPGPGGKTYLWWNPYSAAGN